MARELNRLEKHYKDVVIPAIMKERNFTNVYQVPKIEKIVLNRGLGVMDSTATSLCMDNHIPIRVFGLNPPENIKRVILRSPEPMQSASERRRPGVSEGTGNGKKLMNRRSEIIIVKTQVLC